MIHVALDEGDGTCGARVNDVLGGADVDEDLNALDEDGCHHEHGMSCLHP